MRQAAEFGRLKGWRPLPPGWTCSYASRTEKDLGGWVRTGHAGQALADERNAAEHTEGIFTWMNMPDDHRNQPVQCNSLRSWLVNGTWSEPILLYLPRCRAILLSNGWSKEPCCSGVLIGNPVTFPTLSVSSAVMTWWKRVPCSIPINGGFPGFIKCASKAACGGCGEIRQASHNA